MRALRRTGIVALAVVATAALGATSAHAAATSPVKGLPGLVPSRSALAAGVTYLYAYAHQTGASDGSFAQLTIEQPVLDPADSHTLAEIAVESADNKQIVEIGWTVDRGVNRGDLAPHLFIFHWVNGAGTCYNGCGFVAVSGATTKPGQVLPVGTDPFFGIEHSQGNWWLYYNGEWFGYFPDSLWNGGYTRAGLIQWFGEVAAGSSAPCTDMGDGKPAANEAAAQFTNVQFVNGPTVAPGLDVTNKTYYSIAAGDDGPSSIRFGGPGAC
jgi:hypothetical protein